MDAEADEIHGELFASCAGLRWGGLPPVMASDEPAEELRAYVRTYLQEEILAEGFVRRLPQFSRFLATAALTSGQMLNFARIASDAGVPAATVREYYFLLEDTQVGFLLAGLACPGRASPRNSGPTSCCAEENDPEHVESPVTARAAGCRWPP
jgi:hypothetical protein